jgi:hypothetical protein
MMPKIIVKLCNEDVSATFLCAWEGDENSQWSSERETDRKRERERLIERDRERQIAIETVRIERRK